MFGRLVHSRDFERLRAVSVWSRSTHFAVHHLPGMPARPGRVGNDAAASELSTISAREMKMSVDILSGRHWLGTVLPKRLARRAVTRSLLRRQIHAAVARHGGALPPGLWVVRLRAAFARDEFPSAASPRLRAAAGLELDDLLHRSARSAG
jgi:ribonuclease P protein component